MIKPIDHASNNTLPETVDEAVNQLCEVLSEWDDLPLLPETDDAAHEYLHVSLGAYIRSKFGLWEGNAALIRDCGVKHADDAYIVILDALVKRLSHPETLR